MHVSTSSNSNQRFSHNFDPNPFGKYQLKTNNSGKEINRATVKLNKNVWNLSVPMVFHIPSGYSKNNLVSDTTPQNFQHFCPHSAIDKSIYVLVVHTPIKS